MRVPTTPKPTVSVKKVRARGSTIRTAGYAIAVTLICVASLTSRAFGQLSFGTPTKLEGSWNNHSVGHAKISSDGRSLYFRQNNGPNNEDIWVATRPNPSAPWTDVNVLDPPVNTSWGEWGGNTTADGQTMVFFSNRPGGRGGLDIWMATRTATNEPWDSVSNLGSPVNSGARDGEPEISADGNTLYFTRGQGANFDIYESQRLSPDSWSDPVPLGPGINSPLTFEIDPSISGDGRLMFFAVAPIVGGWQVGEPDIYFSTRASTSDPWGPRTKLPETVNLPSAEFHPDISADGSTLYFNRADCYDCWSSYRQWEVPVTAVPEPSSVASLLAGLLAPCGWLRKYTP